MSLHEMESRLVEYWSWLQRTQGHDVGFHVPPDSWREALRWCLQSITDLQMEIRERDSRIKELEFSQTGRR